MSSKLGDFVRQEALNILASDEGKAIIQSVTKDGLEVGASAIEAFLPKAVQGIVDPLVQQAIAAAMGAELAGIKAAIADLQKAQAGHA